MRTALLLLAGWLGLSALQMARAADLGSGLEAFRLLHAYSLVAVGTAIAFASRAAGVGAARVLLAVALPIALYAAVRVVIGAAQAEELFVTAGGGTTTYGGAVRATGSFSSAVGMTSFFTPLIVFALVYGYLSRRLRWVAWATAAFAAVGVIGSYARAPLPAIALGLLFALGAVLAGAGGERRRQLVAAGLAAAVLVAMYGGLHAASGADPELRTRAAGVLRPFDDSSVKGHFEIWGDVVSSIRDKPLGHGLGASARTAHPTTDMSYLRMPLEQGIPVAALFLAGLAGTVCCVAVRLRRLRGERRAVGIAALAGVVAFLGLAGTAEYLEQPGKVVAWALLGMAVAQVWGRESAAAAARGGGPRRLVGRLRAAALRQSPRRRRLWAVVAAVMVVLPVALSQPRQSEHSATADLVPRRVHALPPVHDASYYRGLIEKQLVHAETGARAGGWAWSFRYATVHSRPDGTIAARVVADTPKGATRLATAFAYSLAGASARQVAVDAHARADALALRLDRSGLAPDARLRLERKRRRLLKLAKAPNARAVVGGPATIERPPGWADRLADAVPGELTSRPAPVWAGLAGALLAAALWAASLGLGARRAFGWRRRAARRGASPVAAAPPR